MIRFIDITDENIGYMKAAKIKYKYTSIEDLWIDLNRLFKEKKVRYIPIIGNNDESLCFAYKKYWRREESIFTLEDKLYSINGKSFLNFFVNLFENIVVQINGFNECAWNLYKLFHKLQIPVKVSGMRWKQFVGESDFIDIEKDVTVESIWNIDVECEKEEELADSVLLAYLEIAYDYEVLKSWKEYLKERNVLFQLIQIPQKEDLKFLTKNEQYRCENRITPYMPKEVWEDKIVAKHLPCDSNGEYFSWEEWNEVEAGKKEKEIEIDGQRISYCEYGSGLKRIYLIGPCIVRGMFVRDKQSLGYDIFYELKKSLPYNIKLICLSPSRGSLLYSEELIQKLLLRKGDAVLCVEGKLHKDIRKMAIQMKSDVDLQTVFDERKTDYFWDCPIHTNAAANMQIAKKCVNEILGKHKEYFKTMKQCNDLVQVGQALLAPNMKKELEQFIEEIKKMEPISKDGCKGAIVMNCNPITLGHLYLISKAREMVDFLYIFIVEEDKSEIIFRDRIEMVKRTVCHMDNVGVFPSGRFMISYMTMPIYFEKEKRQEEIWDASVDLQLFCQEIAPALGISVRFMGEEPEDKVTRQYNEEFERLAPLYGMSFVRLQRLAIEDQIVSASNVRRFLNNGRFDLVQKITPKESWSILRKYNR